VYAKLLSRSPSVNFAQLVAQLQDASGLYQSAPNLFAFALRAACFQLLFVY